MKEYILEVRKIIPQKLCKKIIHYFDNDYGEAGTVGSGVNKDIRNCLTRSISPVSYTHLTLPTIYSV